MVNPRYLLNRLIVEPCINAEVIVIKKTILKIISAPLIPDTMLFK